MIIPKLSIKHKITSILLLYQTEQQAKDNLHQIDGCKMNTNTIRANFVSVLAVRETSNSYRGVRLKTNKDGQISDNHSPSSRQRNDTLTQTNREDFIQQVSQTTQQPNLPQPSNTNAEQNIQQPPNSHTISNIQNITQIGQPHPIPTINLQIQINSNFLRQKLYNRSNPSKPKSTSVINPNCLFL